MKRIFAAIAAFALILGACSGTDRKTGSALSSGLTDTATEILFIVDYNAGETLISAAENFCERVNLLSQNGLKVTLEKTKKPLDDFTLDKAGAILLDGESAALLHPYFSIASERFMYGSYEGFSMTLNSGQALRQLSDACGAKVLAAYYTGSNALVSLTPVNKLFNGADEVKIKASTIPGSGSASSLELSGIEALEIPSASERLQTLLSDSMIAELTYDELGSVFLTHFEQSKTAWADIEERNGGASEYSSGIVTASFHSVTPVWLILKKPLFDGLSRASRAAIEESAAYMTGDIDEVYLSREQNILNTLKAQGVTVAASGAGTGRFKMIKEKASVTDSDERRFRETLERLS